MLKFEILRQEGLMRAGVITTAHGEIKTPAFVGAATRAAMRAVTWEQLLGLRSQAVLVNAYHMLLAPGVEVVERAGGINVFMGWAGPTFTDSGGFQMLSLKDAKIDGEGVTFKSYLNGDTVRMTPEISMRAQWRIGSDIHMAFDQAVDTGDYEVVRGAMERTHRWLPLNLAEHEKLSKQDASKSPNPAFFQPCSTGSRATAGENTDFGGFARACSGDLSKKCVQSGSEGLSNKLVQSGGELSNKCVQNSREELGQSLFAVVQGGRFEDLRRESAEFMKNQPVDGFGLGSLYTTKTEAERDLIKLTNEILPVEKPRHLLGMGGEPRDLWVGVEYGCDTFDCVAPTRMARNGALYTRRGRVNIKNAKFREWWGPVEEGCDCPLCQNYTAGYLHHLFKVDEINAKTLASLHNERWVVRLVEEMREVFLAEGREGFLRLKGERMGEYYG